MPSLNNPKHEAFAYHLAKGMKQKTAYTQAGYEPNDSAASRLATSPVVKTRIEELKVEIYHKINDAMDAPNVENYQSLKDMGLTMAWCANAFKTIYQEAVHSGQLGPANSAVANIQKMVEIEGTGRTVDPIDEESTIKIGEVNALLDNVVKIIEAKQAEEDSLEMVDITPPDVGPVAILQQLESLDNDADHTT
jgi:hypothetical protein